MATRSSTPTSAEKRSTRRSAAPIIRVRPQDIARLDTEIEPQPPAPKSSEKKANSSSSSTNSASSSPERRPKRSRQHELKNVAAFSEAQQDPPVAATLVAEQSAEESDSKSRKRSKKAPTKASPAKASPAQSESSFVTPDRTGGARRKRRSSKSGAADNTPSPSASAAEAALSSNPSSAESDATLRRRRGKASRHAELASEQPIAEKQEELQQSSAPSLGQQQQQQHQHAQAVPEPSPPRPSAPTSSEGKQERQQRKPLPSAVCREAVEEEEEEQSATDSAFSENERVECEARAKSEPPCASDAPPADARAPLAPGFYYVPPAPAGEQHETGAAGGKQQQQQQYQMLVPMSMSGAQMFYQQPLAAVPPLPHETVYPARLEKMWGFGLIWAAMMCFVFIDFYVAIALFVFTAYLWARALGDAYDTKPWVVFGYGVLIMIPCGICWVQPLFILVYVPIGYCIFYSLVGNTPWTVTGFLDLLALSLWLPIITLAFLSLSHYIFPDCYPIMDHQPTCAWLHEKSVLCRLFDCPALSHWLSSLPLPW